MSGQNATNPDAALSHGAWPTRATPRGRNDRIKDEQKQDRARHSRGHPSPRMPCRTRSDRVRTQEHSPRRMDLREWVIRIPVSRGDPDGGLSAPSALVAIRLHDLERKSLTLPVLRWELSRRSRFGLRRKVHLKRSTGTVAHSYGPLCHSFWSIDCTLLGRSAPSQYRHPRHASNAALRAGRRLRLTHHPAQFRAAPDRSWARSSTSAWPRTMPSGSRKYRRRKRKVGLLYYIMRLPALSAPATLALR